MFNSTKDIIDLLYCSRSSCCKPSIHEQCSTKQTQESKFNKKVQEDSSMENGESWQNGLFETIWWTTKMKSAFLNFLFQFLCPSGPKFLWVVSIMITFMKKEDDEYMCV